MFLFLPLLLPLVLLLLGSFLMCGALGRQPRGCSACFSAFFMCVVTVVLGVLFCLVHVQ
ncbi:hypothetical protein HMPREF3190_00974 [Umbribacter vaginalis]|nr:hypothetical protein HMPREF3190_00974 [Coriobacteriales bacterium DNF00809]